MKYIQANYAKFFGSQPDQSSYGEPQELVTKIASLMSAGQLLDLGAGDGRHALYLAKKGWHVQAVDISPDGISKLKKLADRDSLKLQTEIVDLTNWKIDAEYDAIIGVMIFQHLQTARALELMQEMKTHTKSGGFNAISLFTKTGDRFLMDQEEDPESFYPEDGWLENFYDGWKILEFTSLSGPLIGKFRKDGTPMENRVEKILAQKPGQ